MGERTKFIPSQLINARIRDAPKGATAGIGINYCVCFGCRVSPVVMEERICGRPHEGSPTVRTDSLLYTSKESMHLTIGVNCSVDLEVLAELR